MSLQQSTSTQTNAHPLIRILAVAVVLVVAIVALTSIVGVAVGGPSYELVPDPAGLALPF